jgi:serine/threonine-protein kinase
MATVHLGRLLGPVGFSRTVAIKRLHAQFASDPEFVSMFLDEARLAARIRHPNVVPTLDVVATGGELFLVMEYVPGESIARLSRALRDKQQTLPTRILSAVMAGVLHGLHAAHEAKDERGHPLGIVHRDMSPQNVLVGTDGVARVLDFGVAKAAGRMQTTREGQIKGKLSYMPPEQLRGASVNRQSDIYAAGVMLWELVTGQRLFAGDNEGAIVAKVLDGRVEAPSAVLMRNVNKHQTLSESLIRGLKDLDATILRALQSEPENRFATAREMALEVERKLPPATGSEVADWIESIAKDVLNSRAAMVAEIESSTSLSAAEPREGHVQSVLQAKTTLGPNDPAAMLGSSGHAPPAASGSSPPTVTRLDRSSPPPHNQTVAMPGGPPTGHPSYPGMVEGPPVTQPSSISVATGTHGRRLEAERPAGRRTAVAALIGVLLGASVLASALVYRHQQQTKALASESADHARDVRLVGSGSAAATTRPVTPTIPSTATAPTESADAGSVATDPSTNGTTAGNGAGTTPTGAAGAAAATTGGATPTGSTATAGGTTTGSKQPGGKGPRPTGAALASKPASALPAAAASTAVDCSTPVWFDAQGVKHYKQQCL